MITPRVTSAAASPSLRRLRGDAKTRSTTPAKTHGTAVVGPLVAARAPPGAWHEVEDDVHRPNDDRRPDQRAEAMDREAGDEHPGQPEHQHRDAEPDQAERDERERQGQ